jgi:putative protease
MEQHPEIRKKRPLLELLAPAGSPEAFHAAVAAGADAVYLSGKRFGARKFAKNFTDDELKEAIDFAHRRDVRVYVTINTLIHDRELDDVLEYLLWLYSIGTDAVLIQDIGIASLARKIVPLLPLHASTQMTIHSTAGVEWAARLGFSRVVLARELAIEEIEDISQATAGSDIGLEVFAHGALCYCYSGQCLLSSVIGGRSGNRGMCAQPCRKPYSMIIADTDPYGRPSGIRELPSTDHYPLSPKDLCTYEKLPGLLKSPLVSLKIEGRMKSPEYVSIVVSTYRKALDAIAEGRSLIITDAIQDLGLAFNRGLTEGYLFGKRGTDLMGRDAPDNRGFCIGVVNRYDEKTKRVMVHTTQSKIPRTGDGLLFRHKKNPSHEFGFSLNSIPVEKDGEISFRVPQPVEPGTGIFITSSPAFEQRAHRIITHPPAGLRHPVLIDVQVTIDALGRLEIQGLVHSRIAGKFHVMYSPDFNLEPALTHPLTPEQVELHLKKSKDTPFTIRNFTVHSEGNWFLPIARLNYVRREFLKIAGDMMVARARPAQENNDQSSARWNVHKTHGISNSPASRGSSTPDRLRLGVYADSIEGVQGAVEGGCEFICFEPVFLSGTSTCRKISLHSSFEAQVATVSAMCNDAGVCFVLKFPRITRNSYLKSVLPFLSTGTDLNISGFLVENYGTAHALLQANPHIALYGAGGFNIFNHESVCQSDSVFRSFTLSPELSRDEMELLIRNVRSMGCLASFSLIVQGNSEAMVSEDCLLQPWENGAQKNKDRHHPRFFGLRDTTGHIFPVRVDGECRSHIYNSSELCLIDHLPSLLEIGINEVIIDTRGRTKDYARDMAGIYKKAIALVNDGTKTPDKRLELLKETVKLYALGGITAGHYLRGLKE